ncbi:MAG: SDR family NAD(P)-dependent oxidoreductase [Gammaproteobacteria bacterium]
MRLEGRRAVVTGSSQGMGRDIALLLARQGASVVVNARGSGPTGTKALQDVADEINDGGGRAIACPGAVNDIRDAERIIQACVEGFGGIDILVNNAGVLGLGAVDNCSPEHWREVLDINLNGTYYCTHFAVKHMRRQRWGRVVHATSEAALGVLGGACYAASKGAVISLTCAMARDLGMYGITVNAYNPEARSRLSDGHSDEYFVNMLESMVRRGFMERARIDYLKDMGPSEAIAPWVVYLCTEDASYLNGRVFAVEARRIAMLALQEEERVLYRDHARHGVWSLDELAGIAPVAFPVHNRWARRSEAEIAEALRGIDPILL